MCLNTMKGYSAPIQVMNTKVLLPLVTKNKLLYYPSKVYATSLILKKKKNTDLDVTSIKCLLCISYLSNII